MTHCNIVKELFRTYLVVGIPLSIFFLRAKKLEPVSPFHLVSQIPIWLRHFSVIAISGIILVSIWSYVRVPDEIFTTQSVHSRFTSATFDIADWKMYRNSYGLYSFRYPPDWNIILRTLNVYPSSEKKQTGYYIDVMLGPSTTPQISIIIWKSANNISLTDFLNQMFGQFKPVYTFITINGVEGLRTSDISDIPARLATFSSVFHVFEEENVFVKHNSNIYRIVWIKSPATKQITEEEFNKFLSTFKFTD